MLRALLAFGAVALACVACEKLADVSAFKVAETVVPYEGLCNQCLASLEPFRHEPCPASNDGPTTGGKGETYVYAWRPVSVGGDPATLAVPRFDVRLHTACSSRPDG